MPLFTNKNGSPIIFFLDNQLECRSDLLKLIKLHGGCVHSISSRAQYIISNNTSITNSYTSEFIMKCIANERLLDPSLFKPITNPTQLPLSSRKGTRHEFTSEDDELLYTLLSQNTTQAQSKLMYQDFELLYPNHTWQSWRNHALKKTLPLIQEQRRKGILVEAKMKKESDEEEKALVFDESINESTDNMNDVKDDTSGISSPINAVIDFESDGEADTEAGLMIEEKIQTMTNYDMTSTKIEMKSNSSEVLTASMEENSSEDSSESRSEIGVETQELPYQSFKIGLDRVNTLSSTISKGFEDSQRTRLHTNQKSIDSLDKEFISLIQPHAIQSELSTNYRLSKRSRDEIQSPKSDKRRMILDSMRDEGMINTNVSSLSIEHDESMVSNSNSKQNFVNHAYQKAFKTLALEYTQFTPIEVFEALYQGSGYLWIARVILDSHGDCIYGWTKDEDVMVQSMNESDIQLIIERKGIESFHVRSQFLRGYNSIKSKSK